MEKKFKTLLRHVFIPGRHNDHHAAALAHGALTLYLVFSFFSFIVLKNIALETSNVLGYATDISTDRLLSLTNEQRSANGLTPLSYDGQLAAAAAGKAQDMFNKGYWAHFGPNGETPWMFIQGAGYAYEVAGENLAKNFQTSGDVMNAWMNSPTHRENILNGGYKDVGFAIVNGSLSGEDTTLVVQMFGAKSAFVPPAAQPTVSETTPVSATVEETPTPALIQVAAAAEATSAPTQAPTVTATPRPTVLSETGGQKNTIDSALAEVKYKVTPPSTVKNAPSINLYPAFRIMTLVLVAFLLTAFVIDFYHLTRTAYLNHRGKHIAHIIFLVAILTAMFFLGRGSIL